MKQKRFLGLLLAAILFPRHEVAEATLGGPAAQDMFLRQGSEITDKSHQEKPSSSIGKVSLSGLRQADYLFRQGRLTEAEAICSDLLTKEPSNPALHFLRGQVYVLLKTYNRAIIDFSAALLYQDERIEVLKLQNLLAFALLADGQPEKAADVVRPYLRQGTALPAMQEIYLQALFQLGKYEDAVGQASRLWPDNRQVPPGVLRILADSEMRLDHTPRALELYRLALDEQPGDKDVQAGMAYALVFSGKLFEGLSLYDRLIGEPDFSGTAIGDGTALIAQGNVVGGRAIFEKLIARYPDQTEYRERYTEVLAMYGVATQATLQVQRGAAVNHVTDVQQYSQMHEKAIVLARSENYAESIGLLQWLHGNQPDDLGVTFDYAVVLHWSGDDAAAISIFESPLLRDAEIPDYVRQNIAAAYYRQENYPKALELLQPLVGSGDRQARLMTAEILMRRGDTPAAQLIYDTLLSENQQDGEVYLSRAAMFRLRDDYRQVAPDLQKAVMIAANGKDKARLRSIRADLASAYINLGDSDKALGLLAPYIQDGSATSAMEGDYVFALRDTRQYRQAISASRQFWKDPSDTPVFALAVLAECYVRVQDYPQAVSVYNTIVAREGKNNDARFGLAFALMLDGKIIQSLAAYDALLAESPANAEVVARDARFFIAAERYTPGRALFEKLIARFPDQLSYRRQYAEALVAKNLFRAAYSQYQALAGVQSAEMAGLSGMARMALALEDYPRARQALDALTAKYGRSSAVAAISSSFDDRRRGELDTSFTINNNSDQLVSGDVQTTATWQTTAEQNLAGRYWFLAGVARTRIDDFTVGQHVILNTESAGVRYKDFRNNISLWLDQNSAVSRFNGFRLSIDNNLSDQTVLNVSLNNTPLLDIQTLNPANGGPILGRSYAMTLTRLPSTKETASIGLTRAFFNDGNQFAGYSLNHSYILYKDPDRTITRIAYWNRGSFSDQNVFYASPTIRESLGAGWVLRRGNATGYWEGRIVFNWARDYPDHLGFQPYARLEYGHDFSPATSFVAGLEYGTRSTSLIGAGGPGYGYRQVDVSYRCKW